MSRCFLRGVRLSSGFTTLFTGLLVFPAMTLAVGLILFGTVLTSNVCGQDMRIYTKVFNEGAVPRGAAERSAPVVSRSLTVFHSGKAYDYIPEVGEVTIFRPAQREFTILHGSQRIVSTVAFDQIKHKLKLATHETLDYLQDSSPSSQTDAGVLRFQVEPRFDESFDRKSNTLTLSSKFVRYDVKCKKVDSPEIVESYLRYADWTARLNSVLYPQSLLPGPRLRLNETLRRRRLMPVEVELQVNFEHRLHLRAEHQIRWSLDEKDRSHIHHWETLLRNGTLREVTFGEYRRASLLSQSQQR